LAVVIDGTNRVGDGDRSTMASIEAQTTSPATVALVGGGRPWVEALDEAIRTVVQLDDVAGVAIVPVSVSLAPTFVERIRAVLQVDPLVGLVSGWVDDPNGGFVEPPPGFPYQWLADHVGKVFVVRREAYLEAGGLRPVGPGAETWDLANAILAAGWKALAYPAILATRQRSGDRPVADADQVIAAMRDRLPAQYSRDASAVADLRAAGVGSSIGLGGSRMGRQPGLTLGQLIRLPIREQIALLVKAARQPRLAVNWLWTLGTRGAGRHLGL
jgi:hypothetical protein